MCCDPAYLVERLTPELARVFPQHRVSVTRAGEIVSYEVRRSNLGPADVDIVLHQGRLLCLPDSNAVFSFGVWTSSAFRGLGIGQKALMARMNAVYAAGGEGIIATVADYNTAELHILEKHGWKTEKFGGYTKIAFVTVEKENK